MLHLGLSKFYFFMKCNLYWINLRRCVERAARMRKRLQENKKHLSCDEIVRIDAVAAEETLQHIDRAALPSVIADEKLQNAAVGCTLSHLKTIARAYSDGCDWAIVFEDDVTLDFCAHWPQHMTLRDVACNTKTKHPGGYLLLLSWCLDGSKNSVAVAEANARGEQWMRVPRYNVYGSFAYAISRAGMASIVESRLCKESGSWDVCNHRRKTLISADAFLQQQRNVLMSTVPFVAYEGLDSTVHPRHLPLHRKNLLLLHEFAATHTYFCSTDDAKRDAQTVDSGKDKESAETSAQL